MPATETSSPTTAAKNVQVPTYLGKHELLPGILHIGVGNFHRAHLATYMDDLFRAGKNFEWAIVGAGVMLPFDLSKRNALEPQNWLNTLVERQADGKIKARIIGSMIDFLQVDPPKFTALKEKLMDPSIKIVSLTVTEGGYFLDSDGKFNPEHPQIHHDIKNPDQPTTIFGLMVQALQKRRESGLLPFTIMSCDNVPHNGLVTRSVVVGLAREWDTELAEWIDTNVCFPNSMVDRITPATTDAERAFVEKHFGYADAYPVFCEPYRQWVLEDSFSQGRPSWEDVGVQFVKDVAPYETMKIRILNGGHASLCYPAALLGIKYVHEAVQHPVLGDFLDALELQEIIPTVPKLPNKQSLHEYWKTVQQRFSNPYMHDKIDRICFDGSNRQPKFIVPCISHAIFSKGDNGSLAPSANGLALVSVLWCRYCLGETEQKDLIPPNDPNWDSLQEVAKKTFSTGDFKHWLSMVDVYGTTVGNNQNFLKLCNDWLYIVARKGVTEAMAQYARDARRT